jgi:predicted ATPase
MSLDAFRLQNFMAFEDTGWIQLGRLTLVLGRNSSGKTAIIRGLRLLKQSSPGPSGRQALSFSVEGGADVGSFSAALHHGDSSKNEDQITFGFRGSINAQSLDEEIEWALVRKSVATAAPKQATQLPFEVRLGYGWDARTESTRLNSFHVELTRTDEELPPVPVLGTDVYASDSGFRFRAFSLDDEKSQKAFESHSQTRLLPEVMIGERADDLSYREQEQAVGLTLFWHACNNEIGKFLSSIQYIGPIRPRPERRYTITEDLRRKWDLRGWGYWVDYLKTPTDQARHAEKLNFWMRKMNLGSALEPRNIFRETDGSTTIVELMLHEGDRMREGRNRNIKDVGYGASQIIPVIVAALASDDSASVLIEQPELHLHPEAQADIADLLIDSINGSSRHLLVETHSETLLLRLRVELAKTRAGIAKRFRLSPQELMAYFVNRDAATGCSTVGKLVFDERGEFQAPSKFGDFFGQDFKEEMELDRIAAKIGV